MKKFLARIFLFIFGWKLDISDAPKVTRSMCVAAPHTSNWDFPFALAAFWCMGINIKYFIKSAYTKSLFGFFFKWTGAIGVDQNQSNNLVEYGTQLFKENKELMLLSTPEGTRGKVDKWKTGFYHIALNANVPITLGYIDYKNKTAGLKQGFLPTGNFEEDMKRIQDFYLDKSGKFPENYNTNIY